MFILYVKPPVNTGLTMANLKGIDCRARKSLKLRGRHRAIDQSLYWERRGYYVLVYLCIHLLLTCLIRHFSVCKNELVKSE